jgi:hypothetical protein
VIEKRRLAEEGIGLLGEAAFADDGRNRNAPGALARDAPVGAGFDHLSDALLAERGKPRARVDGGHRLAAQV